MTTQTTSVPHVDLNDGNRIPQLGFGVFLVRPGRGERTGPDADTFA